MMVEGIPKGEHRVPRPKRMKLDQFPCPIGVGFICNAECAEAIDDCEAVTCLWLPVYRQAMADHRCARLLKVFAGRWLDVVSRAYLAVSDPSFRNWTNLSHLTGSIHKALRDAGL